MRFFRPVRLSAVVLVMALLCTPITFAKPVTTLDLVTVMPSPTRDQLMASVIAQFEKENPDIKVNLI